MPNIPGVRTARREFAKYMSDIFRKMMPDSLSIAHMFGQNSKIVKAYHAFLDACNEEIYKKDA